eukprot:TRINITY_DN5173_c0_g1_i1.p1 TRINITY_DN5173_c0_g1~~TRINITY_DN5173_c0_g1_i1.p1  ORF type:complete len:250 (-),score=69.79 TRINITY_DN5173_c0_g1_i1:25-774(-)
MDPPASNMPDNTQQQPIPQSPYLPRLITPQNYAQVESGLHRSSIPKPHNYPFIAQLKLKCILLLVETPPPKTLLDFVEENNIKLIHLGIEQPDDTPTNPSDADSDSCEECGRSGSRIHNHLDPTLNPPSESASSTDGKTKKKKKTSASEAMKVRQDIIPTWFCEELAQDALEIILDTANFPVLVVCRLGKHPSGTIVGCLRRLQGWNLTSIFAEYRRFTDDKAHILNEQFIENFIFDVSKMSKSKPDWL